MKLDMSDIRPPKRVYNTVEKIKQAAQTMLIDNIELETPKLVDNSDMYDILYSIANLSNAVNVKSPEIGDDGKWITYNQDGSHSETDVSAKGTSIVFNEEVDKADSIENAKVKINAESDNEIELGQDIYTPEAEWFTEINIKDGWSSQEDYQGSESIKADDSNGYLNIRTTGGLQIDKVKNDDNEDVLLIGSPTRYYRNIRDINENRDMTTYYPNSELINVTYDYIEESGSDKNKYTIKPTFISRTNTLSLRINLLFSLYDSGETYSYGLVIANDTISLLIMNGNTINSESTRVMNPLTATIGSGYVSPTITVPGCNVTTDSENGVFKITPEIVITGWEDIQRPYFEVNLIGHINNYGISV